VKSEWTFRLLSFWYEKKRKDYEKNVRKAWAILFEKNPSKRKGCLIYQVTLENGLPQTRSSQPLSPFSLTCFHSFFVTKHRFPSMHGFSEIQEEYWSLTTLKRYL
jgi:hypothetical protein